MNLDQGEIMGITKQLVGRTIPPGPDIAPGVRAQPILIKTAIPAENKALFIINGKWILTFDEAKEILRGDK
jgi:hypothetical protein